MTRKHTVGHNRDADGVLHPATPWKSYPAAPTATTPAEAPCRAPRICRGLPAEPGHREVGAGALPRRGRGRPGAGGAVGIKPEIRAASATGMPQDYPAAAMGFLAAEGDDYIVAEGGLKGQRGVFTRDADGAVVGVDIAGRLFGRAG